MTTREKIAALRAEGVGVTEIANRLGISKQAIHKALTTSGKRYCRKCNKPFTAYRGQRYCRDPCTAPSLDPVRVVPCPHCGVGLELPVGRPRLDATCPECGKLLNQAKDLK